MDQFSRFRVEKTDLLRELPPSLLKTIFTKRLCLSNKASLTRNGTFAVTLVASVHRINSFESCTVIVMVPGDLQLESPSEKELYPVFDPSFTSLNLKYAFCLTQPSYGCSSTCAETGAFEIIIEMSSFLKYICIFS